MGGRVGLKGTDGKDILNIAIERGAVPESEQKAIKALEQLLPLKEDLKFFVARGEMGEHAVKSLNFDYEVTLEPGESTDSTNSEQLIELFIKEEVDLVLFAGGDGTARVVLETLRDILPVIGIPTGVKIHSPVYAVSPEDAGKLALKYLTEASLSVLEKEVIDIEEEAFRHDKIRTKIYGYLMVPFDDSHLQNLKSPSLQSDAEAQVSAALQVIDAMEEDVYYIIGSGSTTHRILEELDISGTILGVDIVLNKQLVAKDVYEQQILEIIGNCAAKLIVTPMGGQGYLFGRGNQQLSDKVLEKIGKEQIIILSTPTKLRDLKRKPLLVYTGNPTIDHEVSGFYKVVTGYGQYSMVKVEPAGKG